MKNTKLYIYIIATIIIGLTSYEIGHLLSPKPKKIPTNVVRTVLPLHIVSQYDLQQLNALVKGAIIETDKDFITFKTEKGTLIKAYNEPQGITNLIKAESNETLKFSDLKVGNKIEGGISVFVSQESTFARTGQRKPGDVILHNISVTQ